MDLSKNMALVVVDPLRRFTVKGAPFEVDGAESIVNGINELANHFLFLWPANLWPEVHHSLR
jgi:hypothetical protein